MGLKTMDPKAVGRAYNKLGLAYCGAIRARLGYGCRVHI
jgi:hypothetical protein